MVMRSVRLKLKECPQRSACFLDRSFIKTLSESQNFSLCCITTLAGARARSASDCAPRPSTYVECINKHDLSMYLSIYLSIHPSIYLSHKCNAPSFSFIKTLQIVDQSVRKVFNRMYSIFTSTHTRAHTQLSFRVSIYFSNNIFINKYHDQTHTKRERKRSN